MTNKSLVVIALAVLTAIAIPVVLYLTYPVDEGDVVEHVMERVYGRPPQRLPRFVPGVVGYTLPVDRRSKFKGTLITRGREPLIAIAGGDGLVPVIFLPKYRCINNGVLAVPGDAIINKFGNKTVDIVGYLFRTPRGPVVIPVEVGFNSTRCIYLKR